MARLFPSDTPTGTNGRVATTGVVFSLLATVGGGSLNYFYGVALAFMLPIRQYALYGGAQAMLLVTGTIANAAVPWALAQALARARSAGDPLPSGLVASALRLNMFAGLLAGGLVLPLAIWIATPEIGFAVAVASLTYFVASTPMGFAQGVERFGLLAILITSEIAVKVAVGLGWVGLGGGAFAATVAAVTGALFVTGIGLVAMARQTPFWGQADQIRELSRAANGMAAVQLLAATLAALLILLSLERYGAGTITAHLQIAVTLGQVPVYLALAVSIAAFSDLTRRETQRLARRHTLQLYFALAAPVSIYVGSLPPAILGAVLPARFLGADALLPWTASSGFVLGIVTLQVTWLKAIGRFRPAVVALVVSLALAAGCAILSSHAWGVSGLAGGTLVGAVASVSLLWVAGARLPLREFGSRPSRMLLTLALVAVVLVLTRGHRDIWIAAAALFAFLLALLIGGYRAKKLGVGSW